MVKRFLNRNLFKYIWNKKKVFPYFQQQVYFPKNSVIFERAIQEDIYESENINILNKLTKEGSTVFDIGANIGLMAIPMLANAKNINVISLEPSTNSFPFLQKTQEKSAFKNRWTLINKAVSNTIGKINFQLAKPADAAYESILNTNRIAFIHTIEVECTTIDTIWEELERPSISVIKIDIEGADLLALQGATDCIHICKPVILMEWNKTNLIPFDLTNEHLLAFSQQINYTIYALPSFTKCASITDLELFYQINEDFLLSPNQE